MHELITNLEGFFAKAPHLPNNVRELIVKVSPYLAIIGIVFSIPAIFGLLGLGFVTAPFRMIGGYGAGLAAGGYGMMGGFGAFWFLAGIFAIVNMVLLILAFPGLKSRSEKGWRYVFYVALLGALQNLLSFNLVGLIIFTTLNLYILFEIKSHYHTHHEHH